ncbi:hypothetical protein HYV58_02095 [Candidatus Peregrinibacteria bacterium]|nr:hypothetical protein [Candidatus Peregrinibacteria bacterium]
MWWYSFVPSLLTTLIGILYLLYQFFAFKHSELFDPHGKSFLTQVISATFNFLNRHDDLWVPAILAVSFILTLYALLHTLSQGALIQSIAKKKEEREISIAQGISLGMLSFLPLLEYHLLVKTFSIISLFTEAAFMLRNLGPDAMTTFLPVFFLAMIIGLILTLLFTYSEFFIVLKKTPVLAAIGHSAKLVVMSWQHTFLMAILMLIIGIRIIVNIVFVLLVPALLFFSAGLLATVTFTSIGMGIGIVVSLAGLFIASYFTGILNVFANTVWTYTFLELMDEKMTMEAMGE